MECGVPFCHNGCPLGNLIPDWNDLVYRDRWREAIVQLHATNNFPEFTGKLCPAPCEAACVLEIREGDAVSIKQIEVSIVNRAWDEGWIEPQPPAVETGPHGRGHRRRPGRAGRRAAAAPRRPHGHGLRARRVRRRAGPLRRPALQDREVGRRAAAGAARGRGRRVPLRRRRRRRHLGRGAARARTTPWSSPPARASRATCRCPAASWTACTTRWSTSTTARAAWRATPPANPITAAGKHVLVVGGGDTGADCVGHSHREGAASVTQIELLGEPPERRPDDLTPWPRWPVKLRTSYALKEGGERDFAISTTKLTGNGRVQQVHWVQNSGKPPFDADRGHRGDAPGRARAAGDGLPAPEQELLEALGVERDARGNAKAGAYATSAEGVFAAGDARRGQSLIVWAINEGRQCARVADRYLRVAAGASTRATPIATCAAPGRDPRDEESAGTSERFGSPDLGADPPQIAAHS